MTDKPLDEAQTVFNDPPVVLVLRRKAIRMFPHGQSVAQYRNDNLNIDIAIPYTPGDLGKKVTRVATSEEMVSHPHHSIPGAVNHHFAGAEGHAEYVNHVEKTGHQIHTHGEHSFSVHPETGHVHGVYNKTTGHGIHSSHKLYSNLKSVKQKFKSSRVATSEGVQKAMDAALNEMRNLRKDAEDINAGRYSSLRVKEDPKAHKSGSKYAAWVVHGKNDGDKKGKALATLVHRSGTKFEETQTDLDEAMSPELKKIRKERGMFKRDLSRQEDRFETTKQRLDWAKRALAGHIKKHGKSLDAIGEAIECMTEETVNEMSAEGLFGEYLHKPGNDIVHHVQVKWGHKAAHHFIQAAEHYGKDYKKATHHFDAFKRHVSEETIDELSKNTLRSYFQKARHSIGNMEDEMGTTQSSRRHRHLEKKLYMRGVYRNKAVNKVLGRNEETDINELSRQTLGSYVKAASKDAADNIEKANHYTAKPIKYHRDKAKKRLTGIEHATSTLTKEETINELSKKTLKSYLGKAASREHLTTLAQNSIGKDNKIGRRIAHITKASVKVYAKEESGDDTIMEATIHSLHTIMKTQHPAKVRFRDGSAAMIDHPTAHQIMKLHSKVNRLNKKKIEGLINSGPMGIRKVSTFIKDHMK